MADGQTVNLPDLLGAITDGERLNLDVVQCALGVRPSAIPAGKPFEVILLIQNASDVNVDVTAVVSLPEQDAKGKRNRFIVKSARLVVGLRPAEVGFMTLPVSSSPQTAPANTYRLTMELSVKRMDSRKPTRVRQTGGGGPFMETELSDEVQKHLWKLQQMVFSTEKAGRSGLTVPFVIKPATVGEVADFSPGWTSLWTMKDHVDEHALLERVREKIDLILPALKRETVFFPLLDVIQTRFRENGGYYLKAGEAVLITKSLVLSVEQGAALLESGEDEGCPAWVTRLGRVLFDRPDAARNMPRLIKEQLLPDLIQDAARLSLNMIHTVTGEDFGTEEEQAEYVGSVTQRLSRGELDFTHTYLPLVLGGLIANTRIVMPHEVPRETIWLLHKAREQRQPEQDDSNEPIFKLTDQLLDRALNQTG